MTRATARTYAALNHGHFGIKLHRRDKGRKTWKEITTPAYPAKPEGLNDLDGWGKPVNWTTQLIWALEPGGRDEPGVIWCGTMPGGLFRSRDRGTTWEMIETLVAHAGPQQVARAAARIFRAFIRSALIRARRKLCASAFPAAACGSPMMAAPPGRKRPMA